VYTAFSGSHQDAIKKGMAALPPDYHHWEVPYLPIDPKHVGRTYEAIIRINSQSGKGGVAYIMHAEHGLDLPRRLQIEFSKTIQTITEDTGTEISPDELWKAFSSVYMPEDAGLQLLRHELAQEADVARITAHLLVDGSPVEVTGSGNGPIAAFIDALERSLGLAFDVVDYTEHAMSAGHEASAAAYVELTDGAKSVRWGVGIDASILSASLKAVVSAINNQGDRRRALAGVGAAPRAVTPRTPSGGP
jgi:2-isopropylmalate synthase